MKTYTFTHEQLERLLIDTLSMYIEQIEKYDQAPGNAAWRALRETLDGLQAEADLVANGEMEQATLQTIDKE